VRRFRFKVFSASKRNELKRDSFRPFCMFKQKFRVNFFASFHLIRFQFSNSLPSKKNPKMFSLLFASQIFLFASFRFRNFLFVLFCFLIFLYASVFFVSLPYFSFHYKAKINRGWFPFISLQDIYFRFCGEPFCSPPRVLSFRFGSFCFLFFSFRL
jgi:hypothetical protein